MKAMFNGTCDGCNTFRPRCARVFLRIEGTASKYQGGTSVLCDVCRRGKYKGKFRASVAHK